MKIALLGLGTVGQAVFDLVRERQSELAVIAGEPVRVATVVVKNRNRKRSVDDVELCYDAMQVIKDPEYKVIIEAIGGRGKIGVLVSEALYRGKTVITANKELVALMQEELVQAAHPDSRLFCEASVGGAIPLVKSLCNMWGGDLIFRLEGILNTTSNFILYSMSKGLSFVKALARAQKLGYAERDVSFDIEGIDAVHKLINIAGLAMGLKLCPEDVDVSGIGDVSSYDFGLGHKYDLELRQVARLIRNESTVKADVGLRFVNKTGPLGRIAGAANCLVVQGKNLGQVVFEGEGAGGRPTASAILTDLVAALRGQPGMLDCLARIVNAPKPEQKKVIDKLYVKGNRGMSEAELYNAVKPVLTMEKSGYTGDHPWVLGKAYSRSAVVKAAKGRALVIGCDKYPGDEAVGAKRPGEVL